MRKVAIILAVYNGERYLNEQLESLKNQTYSNIEVYIHDDGSSDNSLNIINDYVNDKESKVKFFLVDKTSLHYPQCFIKTLLSIPGADYYAFCDQDDVWFDNKISKAVEAIEKFGDKDKATLFYSAVDYYDGDLNYIRGARFINRKFPDTSQYSLQSLLLGGEAMGMTFLFNNKLRDFMKTIINEGQFDFKDTFMKIYCAACGIVIYSYTPCAKYRRHFGATTVEMNPAGKAMRLINMTKKIFLEKDGMESMQSAVDYICKQHSDDILPENIRLLNIFSRPNSIKKYIMKVFWPKRFRIRIMDEIGFRVAFLLGRI